MTALRVAVVQHDIVWESRDATLSKLAPVVAGAAAAGGRLVVLSEMFADQSVKSSQGIGMKQGMSPAQIWEWDLNWIHGADAIIAEISHPSLGVGYEIAKAHEHGKPVLALYHKRPEHKPSSMIVGSPNVTLFEYKDIDEDEPVINSFLTLL